MNNFSVTIIVTGFMGIGTYFITKILTCLFFDNFISYFGYNLFSLLGFILISLTFSLGTLGLLGTCILIILREKF